MASAATVLEGLAEAGVLEVAFGGGEPFAFREFDELLERLFETTALALNVTTSPRLILAALDGFGQSEGWSSSVWLLDTDVVARTLRQLIADLPPYPKQRR